MKGEVVKGNINDVIAELEAEARRRKGITVAAWLRRRELDRAIAKQFGMTEAEYRKMIWRA